VLLALSSTRAIYVLPAIIFVMPAQEQLLAVLPAHLDSSSRTVNATFAPRTVLRALTPTLALLVRKDSRFLRLTFAEDAPLLVLNATLTTLPSALLVLMDSSSTPTASAQSAPINVCRAEVLLFALSVLMVILPTATESASWNVSSPALLASTINPQSASLVSTAQT
jgi:hypothetical protein